jgi:mannitol-1-phosphate/altronate dehydrogenase
LKDKSINGTHAISAWMGVLHNFKTIGEAIENPQIKKFVIEMLEEE